MRRQLSCVLFFAAAAILRTGAQNPISPPATGTEPLVSPAISDGSEGTSGQIDTKLPAKPTLSAEDVLNSLSPLQRKTLPLEIAVANYYELVAMSRRLSLPESGSAVQLRERLYAWYGMKPPVPADGSPTVVIEKADKASLFQIEGLGGAVIKISGGVRLSVRGTDGTSHRIAARTITYDKDRNAVSAAGGVRYERESAGAIQVFTGATVVADLDTWTGVFVDGGFSMPGNASSSSGTKSAQSTTSGSSSSSLQGFLGNFGVSSSGLAVTADRIVKRTGDVILVDGAEMTSCTEENPHYVIRAGKAWMLGSGDWAVADASLFIGGVPVLWLPFFYYPSEEIVFHPVIGSRTREGRYIQTTTWILGEKQVSSSSGGFLSIGLENAATRRSIEGVFFRTRTATPDSGGNSGSSATAGQKTSGAGSGNAVSGTAGGTAKSFLKVLVDAYSNLGIYAGLEGSFPDKAGKSGISFTVGLGLSRSLFYTSTGRYSPYSSDSEWRSVWNQTDLGFVRLPFRFGGELKSNFILPVGQSRLSATIALPAFSDPYFEQDFRGRVEDMEWLKIFSQTTTDSAKPSKRSSLIQRIDIAGSLQPRSGSAGLLSSVDLSRVGMAATWYAKTASYTPPLTGSAAALFAVSPQRDFFYPDTVRFFDFGAVFRGNLGRFPAVSQSSTTQDTQDSSSFRLPPAQELPGTKSGESQGNASAAPAGSDSPDRAAPALDFRLPGLSGSTKNDALTELSAGRRFTLSADWNLAPSLFFEDRFLSDSWTKVSDIDYRLFYSLLSMRMTGGVDARAGLFNDTASISAGIGLLGQGQLRPYFNDTRSDTSTVHPLLLSDYQYGNAKLTGNFRSAIAPFKNDWLWALSSIAYTFSSNLYAYRYSGLSGPGQTGNPIYESKFLAWDTDSVTAHNASMTLAIRPAGLTQQLSFTANLPPLDESYTLRLDTDAGFLKFNIQGQAIKSSAASSYTLNPLTAGISLGSGTSPRLTSTLVYNIQNVTPDSLTANLSWKSLNSSLAYKYSSGYTISPSHTWISDGTQSFRAESFTASFNPAISSDPSAKNPFSITMNSGLTQNLARFSESRLSLGVSSKISIGKDFTLSFAGTSQNTSAWRYYTFLFKPSGGFDPDDYSRNIFSDLVDAISIWDSAALKRSLMKLSTLSVSMQQNLHDWDLGATVSAAPLLVEVAGGKPYYTLDISFSVLVKWHDIPGISTTITKDTSGLSY